MKLNKIINKQSITKFAKFCLSSGTSFIIDLLLFQCFLFLQNWLFPETDISIKIWIATIIARIISSLYNFTLNKLFVFSNKSKLAATMPKYYVLCIAQMCCSALLVSIFCSFIFINETIIKFFVDIILFIISYQIQNKLIFK